MSDDLLNRASRALRDQEQDPGQAPPGARLRVIEAAGRARKAEARQMAAVTALGVVMLASTAVAAATGHLQQAVAVVKAAVGLDAPVEEGGQGADRKPASQHRTAPAHAVALAAPASQAQEVAQPAPVQADPEPVAAPVAAESAPAVAARTVDLQGAPRPVRTAAAPAVVQHGVPQPQPHAEAPVVAAPKPADQPEDTAEDQALLAFRSAQRLHAQHQWSAALVAWENYLKVAPRGELAPEARWSRAQCLVHLGRLTAARAALQPFASGAEGGYHQADAVELLQALDTAGDRTE